MLKHEVEPFADAHTQVLDEIRHEIFMLLGTTHTNSETVNVPKELMQEWHERLGNTKTGFHRFKVCSIDEWNQKERLTDIVRICKTSH